MPRILLALIISLALAGCYRATDQPTSVEQPADTLGREVPIRFEGRGEAALMMPVHINGEGPFDFILDTGATMTCLSEELAEQLDLPAQIGATGFGAGIGGAGQVALVTIDSLRVGGNTATGVGACIIDLAHMSAVGLEVDGLLGLNFLRSFRLTLDFERDIARFDAIN